MNTGSRAAGLVLLVFIGVTAVALLARTAGNLMAVEIPEATQLPTSADLPLGGPAPGFRLATTEGDSMSLEQLRGQVVLVNFWASWCGPCRLELPALQQLYEREHSRGLTVAAISLDSGASVAADFAAGLGLTFPVLMAADGVQAAYRVIAVPALFLVDRAGALRYRHLGYAPGVESTVAREAEELLAEP